MIVFLIGKNIYLVRFIQFKPNLKKERKEKKIIKENKLNPNVKMGFTKGAYKILIRLLM